MNNDTKANNMYKTTNEMDNYTKTKCWIFVYNKSNNSDNENIKMITYYKKNILLY